ncbi:MAG TPA: chemotaxis protein CheD [Gaiellaceae bacterium]|nr:chemotaxis protein CheD [Gaiellaceae bacterium]
MTTILGSCVSVCLFDDTLGAGGINHYLLPHRTSATTASPRFAGTAIRQLVDALVGYGCRKADLRAKVFGGARVLDAFHDSAFAIGAQNARVAFELLDAEGIAVVAQDVGGDRGRKLVFQTDDGVARVAVI